MDIADRLRLDVPVGQAGMGGGLVGASLAAAVAKAGGLGTLGLVTPRRLRTSIKLVRDQAPGRAVAVNLLMPFVRRHHVAVLRRRPRGRRRVGVRRKARAGRAPSRCRDLRLRDGRSPGQARAAVAWGADGLIAQGREAGGHLVGTMPALDFLPHALTAAGKRPVFLAGGIATGADTRAALDAGASGVIAGTRFLLTHEANASREYQQRIMQADKTIETNLFGFSWPLRHRVVPNAATRRWCGDDGKANVLLPLSTRRAAHCLCWAISTPAR
jgi:nitronate monooxygenase